ncbi:GbpC/Spa domain-containing protein [Ligilactobacillus agilis]|uniref:GbpC/Spa domain-containing protein n=1 Tax=Ligilactobacillus agilis TaxID=1601 RepID=UPI0030B9FFF7
MNKTVADYQSKLKEYKDTLATGEISTSDIYNGLHLQNEPIASISYKILNNKVKAEIKSGKNYTAVNGNKVVFSNDTSNILLLESIDTSNLDGEFVQVTFDNLSNSKYNEVPIRKIIATFSNAKHQTSASEYAKAPIRLDISNNIKDGMHYYNASEVSVSYQFYDDKGKLIDLGKDNTAWIAVKSLNAIYWKSGDARNIEEVKLDSSGTGYKLKGSPVVRHSDGFWYSDETTDNYGISEDRLGKINQIPYGTNWDGNPDLEYMGSALFNVTGKTVSFTYKAYDADVAWISGANTDKLISGPWVVLSTSIMKDSSGLVAPNVSYNYSTVIACLRLHR